MGINGSILTGKSSGTWRKPVILNGFLLRFSKLPENGRRVLHETRDFLDEDSRAGGRKRMRLMGFADEAADGIGGQIEVIQELGWTALEIRALDGINVHDVSDAQF